LEERRFTTPVDFQLDGTEFLVTSPGETMYVGTPSDQIDRAWEELLWGRYFSISEEEAKDLWGADYGIYYDRAKTGYSGGLVLLWHFEVEKLIWHSFDMFHQLHCLVRIMTYCKDVTESFRRIKYGRPSIETTIPKHLSMAQFI
jgi:hypothetical protein